MEAQDLKDYKEKLSQLTEEEQKQRDLYLKGLSNGTIQGPETGYVSIDKPQLKYYRDEPIEEINPNQTIYNLIFNNKNMDEPLLSFLGTDWNKSKLKEETDRLAERLAADGVKLGDTVLIGASNSLDTVVSLLAINKIGACSKWFDIRASEEEIAEYANSSNCKCMIAFDMIADKISKVIDNTGLQNVILLNPVQRLSNVKQLFLKVAKPDLFFKKPDDERFVRYLDYIKSEKLEKVECAPFDKDRASIMIQSSGTTGKAKTIVHSDYSATQCTKQIAYSDIPLGKGKSVLVALPPWIAYGLGNAIILPLALGSRVELCSNFDPDAVYKNIGNFTTAYAAPFHYRYLRDNFKNLNNKQINYFKNNVECLISGGDKISVEENKEFEEIFNVPLVNGYGNNESWGVLTVNSVMNNKYGTVGIPKYGETIYAYDSEKGVELNTGEVGELYARTDTAFIGYENKPKETSEVKKQHIEGTVVNTGDIGYVDKDGYVHLSGRARRVIVRLGFKISAYTIEDNMLYTFDTVTLNKNGGNSSQILSSLLISEINSLDAICGKTFEIHFYIEVLQEGAR